MIGHASACVRSPSTPRVCQHGWVWESISLGYSLPQKSIQGSPLLEFMVFPVAMLICFVHNTCLLCHDKCQDLAGLLPLCWGCT